MDVIREDKIIQILDSAVDNWFIVSNLSQIYNALYVDNNEKKKLQVGVHSLDDAVCCISMVSTDGWKIKNVVINTDFAIMESARKQANREIVNEFGYFIGTKKPVKSKPNYQFTNKLQYLLTKNRISILSKRNLKKQGN